MFDYQRLSPIQETPRRKRGTNDQADISTRAAHPIATVSPLAEYTRVGLKMGCTGVPRSIHWVYHHLFFSKGT